MAEDHTGLVWRGKKAGHGRRSQVDMAARVEGGSVGDRNSSREGYLLGLCCHRTQVLWTLWQVSVGKLCRYKRHYGFLENSGIPNIED